VSVCVLVKVQIGIVGISIVRRVCFTGQRN